MKGAYRVPDERLGYEPTAYAEFGTNAWIVPPVRVIRPERIAVGSDVVVMEHATLAVLADGDGPPLLRIGSTVHLARFCSIVCEVGVDIGPGVGSSDAAVVMDTWRLPVGDRFGPLPEPAPVVIGANAYLGMSSIVGPGVHVGEGAYVGEGAIVLDDVPPHSVVRGNPARVVSRYDEAAGTWQAGG